jgi:hypothetical protein
VEPVTCYLAEAFYNIAMFNQEKYYVAAGDEPAVHDAFVHFRTVQAVQDLLNREEGTVPPAYLGRLRISRTTLGGLNPEQGIIEKTVDRLLYDSDDVESSIVKEIPEFLTPGVAI